MLTLTLTKREVESLQVALRLYNSTVHVNKVDNAQNEFLSCVCYQWLVDNLFEELSA
jgi:hypothetical protein